MHATDHRDQVRRSAHPLRSHLLDTLSAMRVQGPALCRRQSTLYSNQVTADRFRQLVSVCTSRQTTKAASDRAGRTDLGQARINSEMVKVCLK